MIIGVGTDIVNIKRIEKVLTQHPVRFINRLLTNVEQQEIKKHTNPRRKITWVAKRFAAKEAISKALGTGISATIRFHDMEIIHDDKGKPEVILSNHAQNYLASLGPNGMLKTVNLSLSDDYPWAQAFVVIEAHSKI